MIQLHAAVDGMRQAETRFTAAATRIAQATTPSDPTSTDTVELSAEIVKLLDSRNHFAANVNVVQAGDEMTKATLDLLA